MDTARDNFPGPEIHDDNGELWGWEASPSFLVVTDDVAGAMAALESAVPRFLATTFSGRELGSTEDYDGTEDTDTPSDVGSPRPWPRGVLIDADTSGNLSVKMRDHMVAIIGEELERHGVTGTVEVQ